jgi:transposase
MDATTVAVDLAKDIFEVAVANRGGRIFARKRLTRPQFERFLDTLTAGTTVVMEACGTAHYWGRRCQARQLRVRLLPGQYVRPYVRRNKTDRTDTEALLEANRCGGVDAVPVKTLEQQTLQVLHRVRTQWQAARTARINAMRGILREHGFPIGVGAHTALKRIPTLVNDSTIASTIALPDLVRRMLRSLLEEVRDLDARLASVDQQLALVVRHHPVARRLHQIPGVGVITATALVGAVGHIHAFRRGRHFASWLGLTPRESSSGTRRHLGGISKRGDIYLRCLLTHGARSVLLRAQRAVRATPRQATRFQRWAVDVGRRRGHNKAAIAVANKLARIIWAVWSRDRDFDPEVGAIIAA